MSQIKMSVLMRIFPKSVKNGRNQASKSAKDLEVFFCPFLEERNFRNEKSMVQYQGLYEGIRYHRGRAEHKSHAGQSDMHLKNKSNLFLWQVQSGASCYIFTGLMEDCCIIFEPRLSE